jgi:hypothetical protein
MRTHVHECPECGEEWRCSAGPVSDGYRAVCCTAEFDARGRLYCSQECEDAARVKQEDDDE